MRVFFIGLGILKEWRVVGMKAVQWIDVENGGLTLNDFEKKEV